MIHHAASSQNLHSPFALARRNSHWHGREIAISALARARDCNLRIGTGVRIGTARFALSHRTCGGGGLYDCASCLTVLHMKDRFRFVFEASCAVS